MEESRGPLYMRNRVNSTFPEQCKDLTKGVADVLLCGGCSSNSRWISPQLFPM